MNSEHYTTIGMDVSDRKTQVCVMGRICVIHPNPAAPIMRQDGKGT